MSMKVPIAVRLDEELVERLRNAVWWIGRGLSITDLTGTALTREVEKLERQHNEGQPFPKRKGSLVGAGHES